MTRETFLAWFAGFVDGEGTIGLSRKAPNPKNRTYGNQYRAYLSLVSTNQESVRYIRRTLEKIYGHAIGTSGVYKQKKNEKHKDFALFSVTKYSDLRLVLQAITPNLIIKGPQARLLLNYISHRLEVNGRMRGKKLYTFTGTDQSYYESIRTLNHRGK